VSGGRRLAGVLLALACSAFGLWLATRLVWGRRDYLGGLRGPVTVSATGAQLRPELAATALVALAAAAAVVATSGWARRLVGALVALAGGWAVSLSWVVPDAPAPTGAAAAGAVAAGAPERTAAPLLGVVSGVLLLAAGLAVAVWASGMPRLGARYAAPRARPSAPDRDTGWWAAMDAGEDPTRGAS
jgi:uncharacterized membrane protein (TIGR02234 family)